MELGVLCIRNSHSYIPHIPHHSCQICLDHGSTRKADTSSTPPPSSTGASACWVALAACQPRSNLVEPKQVVASTLNLKGGSDNWRSHIPQVTSQMLVWPAFESQIFHSKYYIKPNHKLELTKLRIKPANVPGHNQWCIRWRDSNTWLITQSIHQCSTNPVVSWLESSNISL